MKRTLLGIITLLFLASVFVSAQEPAGMMKNDITLPQIPIDLKAGEGKDKVSVQCNICHSVDYILMQPVSSRAVWAGSVTKMRKVFGAPINDADAEIIINYLAAQYGNGK